jgi:hypothetical protein
MPLALREKQPPSRPLRPLLSRITGRLAGRGIPGSTFSFDFSAGRSSSPGLMAGEATNQERRRRAVSRRGVVVEISLIRGSRLCSAQLRRL